ncbi:uncharacterized protein LOC114844306 isoform X2 [Betta splendens]|uniref:Uncharacterized protein LOC114844306 isoform X2 n=1 Tax=Betta splendens TaxID=158456 RepID=A0A6P7KY78_BETSP|nr:uncharacterized protein LOC114844306 isoform X2 [Betta splendens]
MEESAGQQEKIEGAWEGRHDGGKDDWKNECSISSFLKHSCLRCWSTSRDADMAETDERVLAKAAEIRELENALTVENLELQEQQSDRKELEETLVKLDNHKDKLIQQIKTTRQLCYEESQQILSLQAEEVRKESQVEEFEGELARARWRLRKLREEVKHAKRRVEEAGERNTPLQDSIRQSYEEILQEENTLCSLSGGAVTPESQLEESTSPADTTEDDPLPLRPWGRSQSLPAYADLIMRTSGSSFCNNLAATTEADNCDTSSPKIFGSDTEDTPEEEISNTRVPQQENQCTLKPGVLSHLDFYQADPFSHCQRDHDLFNDELFPNCDLSDGFTSDPFKGSNPFSADVLFPEVNAGTDDADTSLSCAENKASTGTQCFESEFPEEGSDIEISYSTEDLEAMTMVDESLGFKPIQSSSEELGPQPIHGWRTHSTESDPNGYELDLGAISPPSDIEEQSLWSLAKLEEGVTSMVPDLKKQVLSQPDWTDTEQTLPPTVCSTQAEECVNNIKEESPDMNSVDFDNRPGPNQKLSFELSYNLTSEPSFDPYGFKLSPEHVSHTLLDPDEDVLNLGPTENDPFAFNTTCSHNVQGSDPYGFKLSPEEHMDEVLEYCEQNKQEPLDNFLFDNEQVQPPSYSKGALLEPHNNGNQEVLGYCIPNDDELLDLYYNGNREVLDSSSQANKDTTTTENQELLVFSHDCQEEVKPLSTTNSEELLEPCNCGNQEVLGPCSHGSWELLDFSCPENQETLDFESNQEVVDFSHSENKDMLQKESLELGGHDNQEVLDLLKNNVLPEGNNNRCFVEPQACVKPNRSSSDSSDSHVASEELNPSTTSSSNACASNLLEGDLTSVFGAGGYIGCPDVADDLEFLDRTQTHSVAELVKPVRPVRPPRPSLRAQEKNQSQAQDIDLK